MVSFRADTTYEHCDYRIDKMDRFLALLPYLYPKLSGSWLIELVELDIKTVRELIDHIKIPEYVKLYVVLTKDVLAQVQLEHPDIVAVQKTTWEYYNDLIAKLPMYIESKASSMLYNRLPHDRALLKQTLDRLVKTCEDKGSITVNDVKGVTLNHRVYYSNQVIKSFAIMDKNRWKIFNDFELELGREYAFYALRKYVKKLFQEKCKYLQNEDYKDRNVEVIDTYTLIFLYGKFNECKPQQLTCIFSELDSRRKGETQYALL